MKTRLAGFVVGLALLGVSQADATIYDVYQDLVLPPGTASVSIIGQIIPDGKILVMHCVAFRSLSCDIVGRNITITGTAGYLNVTTGDQTVLYLAGNDLVASATTLSFLFSGTH